MPKFLPGNTVAQKGEAKRLPWYGTIAPVTMALIKQWAKELNRSESQIIDEAILSFTPPKPGRPKETK